MPRNPVRGTDLAEELFGTDDQGDLIIALAGNDSIYSGGGHDLIYAGEGDDFLLAGQGDDRAFGGAGNDALSSMEGSDTIFGGAGSDILVGGTGTDWLYGGADNDLIVSTTGSTGGEENHLFGGAGNDRLIFNFNDSGTADGGTGTDLLDLTCHDVSGLAGPVVVSLIGGNGSASFGTFLLTISGIESLRLQTYTGDDTVTAGDGDDVLNVDLGRNVVNGGGGNDIISYHTAQANTLDGGSGIDTLLVSHTPSPLALNFSAASGAVTDGFGSSLLGFEKFIVYGNLQDDRAILGAKGDQFHGRAGDDIGYGGGGRDTLRGQGGDDTLFGDEGNDWINGGFGDDVLEGGNGNDVLIGNLGSDVLTGGTGADRFRFYFAEQFFDHITDFASGTDHLVFTADGFGLAVGALDPSLLAINAADAAHGQFVFHDAASSVPSELRWDPDGIGQSLPHLIVVLDGINSLSAADFMLI